MKRLTAALGLALLAAACQTNPFTGRSQLMLIDMDTEFALGRDAYQQILSEYDISEHPAEVRPVERVGPRIAREAELWAAEAGVDMPFEWEWTVIADPDTANAFCLPGGRIGVFNGIYPIAQNEAGLAVIMGHEVAHALLRHGAERMSQGLVAQVGMVVVAASLHDRDPGTIALAMAAYGVAANVAVLLPYSRDQESEADRVGLILASRAGYNPREGIGVWQRMEEEHGGGPPEFLSTHPAPQTRIQNMEMWMPEVMPIYDASDQAPVAALPTPGHERIAGPVALEARGMRAWREPDGLVFTFTLEEDAFVEELLVTGPQGYSRKIEPNAPATGGQEMQARIPGAAPAGDYAVQLQGRRNGRGFQVRMLYRVP